MFRKKVVKPPGRQRPVYRADSKPAAFSYYARRSDEIVNTGRQIARTETAAQARATSRFFKQRLGLSLFLGVVTISLGFLLNVSSVPTINVEGSEASRVTLQDSRVYQQAVEKYLAGSLLNRTKFSVSTSGVERHLRQQFLEISSARVGLPAFSNQPIVYIKATQPVLLLATSKGTYAIDDSGTALASGAQLAKLKDLNLPLLTDESGVAAKLRGHVLTSQDVRFTTTVVAQLKARKLALDSLTLLAGSRELDVRLAGQPYVTKFNLATDSARQQVGTFLAVYDRLASQQVTPGEYVDVRVDGRAYYK